MNKKIFSALVLAIIFQFLVLTGMYVSAALPLWTGTEVRIKTIPVDPRSMFRGNYALMQYDISRLSTYHFPEDSDLRNGEVVYITLSLGEDGLHQFAEATLDKPADKVFLRGRIANRRYEDNMLSYRIKYGIEAFFAPKEKALQLEKELRDGGVAILMISSGGKARLKDIVRD